MTTTDAETNTSAWLCAVCGGPSAPEARADCYRCGEYFHLRLTTTATGPDCGDVWIDDEVMALQFACRICLVEQRGEDAQTSVAEEPATAGGDASPPDAAPDPEPPRPRAKRASVGTSARDLARRRR